MSIIKNPVLTGFNPDPVLFRDDDRYYIVVSTFEWLPGVRIYSSENLIDWHYETSVLTSPEKTNLKGNPVGCSIWGPFATYHNGKYYIVYTNVNSTRVPYKDVNNYIVCADNIHGPWSEPVYVNSSGFDPSIFFDDDGKAYFLNELWDYRLDTHNKSCGIIMQEIDPVSWQLIGTAKKIFDGTEARKTEAPQIYKRNGWYYLLTAEGGTELGHQETVARSKNIWGPYEVAPNTPLITSKGHPELSLQSSGHGSLMETKDHHWFMSHLCTRPLPGDNPILGRETAIQSISWENDWPKLTNGGELPADEVQINDGNSLVNNDDHSFKDPLTHGINSKYWNTLRQFIDPSWCLQSTRGVIIKGGQSPQSTFDQHILATRQCDFNVDASVEMDYQPKNYMQLAGMTLYLDTNNYILLMVTADNNHQPIVVLQESVDSQFKQVCELPVAGQHFKFRILLKGTKAEFYITDKNQKEMEVGVLDVAFLSGGYTGNFIGFDAIDMFRNNSTQATFTNFIYQKID